MANEVTATGTATGAFPNAPNAVPSACKGKGKFVQEEVADDDDDDEEEEEEDEEEEEEEDDLAEIDPSVIIGGTRRTRGVRVDYTSPAALEKAGLKPEDADDDEGEESFIAKDVEMQED